ncbi:hypothetical protein [Spiroplasma endosymbiont of Amphimallon solstitiale]|uniref:hypothetical protein n=1 Tax=Spiroplasma endosymbiont of Amphimallon solstitiale TaxID=3066288 RepID=UPI00313CF729
MNFNYLWTLKEATKRMYQSFRDDVKNQWEKTDWRILKERDRKYIPVKIKTRTRNTINGLVTYKCRDYKYYDEQLKKWVPICLLDEKLQLPKYKRTCQDIKNNVIEHFFNYVEKYGWPKIIHQFTLKILFLIKNLLKVTLFSVKIL